MDQLNNPYGLDVDTDGTLFIADQSNHRVVSWAPGATEGSTPDASGTSFCRDSRRSPQKMRSPVACIHMMPSGMPRYSHLRRSLRLPRSYMRSVAPTLITKIEVVGDRIFVADAAMSVHLARYVRDRNRLAVFADDPVGRCVTAFAPLDYDTVAVADKFGNVSVLRLGQIGRAHV